MNNIEEATKELELLTNSSRILREKLLKDPYRPRYHIVTPEGVCSPFDPNGALFYKGRYHLMYIVQTEKGHCWAHISSSDLVHWRHHPLALEPGEGDTGIFSGGASLDKNGIPVITYWGLGNPRGICIATSNDDMLEAWTKSPHNPVISETQHGLADIEVDGKRLIYGAADPSAIWIHNGRYYLLTGNLLVLREYGFNRNQVEHQGDSLYLFVSDDLAKWEYLHPFYTSDRKWTRADEDNMCPDFFPLPSSPDGKSLSDRYMILFISHNLGCQYYIGKYEDDHFYPETHGRMTWSDNSFFAPESLVDGKGRRIMWSWVFEGLKVETLREIGWSGTMSLPRVLWLGEDNTLRMRPVEELQILRYNPRRVGNFTIKANSEMNMKDIYGDNLELNVEMTSDDAEKFGIKVFCSPDGEEQTAIFYDRLDKKLKIDTTKSGLGEGPRSIEGGPFELKPDEPLKLRVFVDTSVVEAFANDRQAVMRRVYPTLKDSIGVTLFSHNGDTKVKSIEAWNMAPSNPY